MKWWLLAGTISFEVAATLSLRGAIDHPAWYALVVVGYCASFILLAAVLRLMPVGVAYGIWGAGGITLTALLAAVLFNDSLTIPMVIGMGLVIAGVLVVELGSQEAANKRAGRDEAA
ncbi:DMT family transporter [Tomitella biformata]|uniref:DMT family transporter n=1 Tax=Tomitella biformata TaxID=630403 RepID=UPI000463B9B6|nr:multidrug efflux SMR transporter [Tomitella biformata]